MLIPVSACRNYFGTLIQKVVAVVVENVFFLVQAEHALLGRPVIGGAQLPYFPVHFIIGVSFLYSPNFFRQFRFRRVLLISKRLRVIVEPAFERRLCDPEVKFFPVIWDARSNCGFVEDIFCQAFSPQWTVCRVVAIASTPF